MYHFGQVSWLDFTLNKDKKIWKAMSILPWKVPSWGKMEMPPITRISNLWRRSGRQREPAVDTVAASWKCTGIPNCRKPAWRRFEIGKGSLLSVVSILSPLLLLKCRVHELAKIHSAILPLLSPGGISDLFTLLSFRKFEISNLKLLKNKPRSDQIRRESWKWINYLISISPISC